MSLADLVNLTRVLAVVTVALCAGCSDSESPTSDPATESQDENVARSQVERGPVRLTVTVDPKSARLSDEPTLTLTLDYEQGVKVTKPPFGESLGDFIIRDFHEPLPETKDDREIIRQVYALEPTRVGSIPIPSISVTFHDARVEGDAKQHSIESEELTVEITSVLVEDVPSLADLKPPAGPVELPETGGASTWWILRVVLIVVIAGGLFWFSRLRRKSPEKPKLSPYELAYLELEQLIEANLAETDVKLFYVELTGIVRRYIERTTPVHAPEQTTEEFLREISEHQTFSSNERERLKRFLESADLVKFAALHPDKQDVEQSFERTKSFIGLNREATNEVAA